MKELVELGFSPKEAAKFLIGMKNETAKDILIYEMSKSKEEMSKLSDEMSKLSDETIKLQNKVIGEKNAELLAVKCRLDLRSVMEDFEGLYVAKGTRKSVRENKWDHILRTNQLGIVDHLF